eukprot:GHVU01134322.1.p1 GENE.GHVU01134322.1~~GHVU01134322.1.p1  ORF type:complete len:107 (+),score=22.42 GHVU01134322.1:557-877(+)
MSVKMISELINNKNEFKDLRERVEDEWEDYESHDEEEEEVRMSNKLRNNDDEELRNMLNSYYNEYTYRDDSDSDFPFDSDDLIGQDSDLLSDDEAWGGRLSVGLYM